MSLGSTGNTECTTSTRTLTHTDEYISIYTLRLPKAFNVSLISPEVYVAHNQRGGNLVWAYHKLLQHGVDQ